MVTQEEQCQATQVYALMSVPFSWLALGYAPFVVFPVALLGLSLLVGLRRVR